MAFSGIQAPKREFTCIQTSQLQLESGTVLDEYEVLKDNYLRKTAALVTEKATGEKKILIRLNARDFKNDQHRQAMAQVIVMLTTKQRAPCLVQYERFLRDGDDFFLVQQNYQYGRLKDLMNVAKQKGKPFSESFVKNWLAHLLVALSGLHDKKLLHNNIVISNIFVDEKCLNLGPTDGFCRILDHPRSFAGTQEPPKLDPEKEAEKLEYNSPEILGKKLPSYPYDIWCVGIVTYYMAAMKYPFHADNPDMITQNILRTQPDYAILKKNGYSEELADFIQSCLNKTPEERANANHLSQHPYIMDSFTRVRAKTA